MKLVLSARSPQLFGCSYLYRFRKKDYDESEQPYINALFKNQEKFIAIVASQDSGTHKVTDKWLAKKGDLK